MWILIDQIKPNKPVMVNMDNMTDVTWEDGVLCFETVDSKCITYECGKDIFIKVAQALDIQVEVE